MAIQMISREADLREKLNYFAISLTDNAAYFQSPIYNTGGHSFDDTIRFYHLSIS